MSRIAMTISLYLAIAGMAGKAGAQFLQYTPPGGPQELPESRKEQMEREIAEADHHLGAIHIAPWASLHDVAYVRSIVSTNEETPEDFTATLGAGFRAYLRNGPKAVWRGQVLPELVWWSRQTERQHLNGRYILGFHGFFNRMTLEVQGGREQRQQIVTPEVPVLASARRDLGEILAEVEVSRAFSVFTATSLTRQKSVADDVEDPVAGQLSLLDREDRIARVGVRWRPWEQWSFALGAERTETEFDSPLNRSNAGTAPVAEVRFRGRRLGFQAELADRSLEARRGSAFVPYDEVTGSASVTVGTANQLSGTLYGNRNLIYSLSPDYPYLTDQRVGFSLGVGVGQRTLTSFFVEAGDNEYTPFDPAAQRRQEDVVSYGATISLRLAHRVSLGLQALRSEFNSTLPGGDRSYSSVGTTLNLLGELGGL